MSRLARCRWLPILVGIALACPEARAQTTPPQTLNMLPGGSELAGRPPELFANLRDGLFAVVDPLDARVAIFNRSGAVLGKSAPLSFFPTTVRESTGNLEYVNADGRRYATLSRTVMPNTVGSLDEFEGAFPPPVSNVQLRRRNGRQITMRIAGPVQVTLRIPSSAGGYLSSAKLVGRDDKGQIYVQTSEIVDMRPTIDVRVFVKRFASDGMLLGTASVPTKEMDSVPSKFVVLTRSGTVDVIVPKRTGLFLQSLSFQPAGKKATTAAASPPLQTPISATVRENPAGGIDDPRALEARPVIRPTSRADIIVRARRYLEISWLMKPQNFTHSGVDNRCEKSDREYWLRPWRLTEATVGKKVSFTPYLWGGSDTPDSFLAKIADGALAGSVCACREAEFNYCQVNFAAGVDSSGLVSRSWGIPKYGTANLDRVATPITNFSKLRPGDVLSKSGSHMKLFVGMKGGSELRVEVIESTSNLRCEGVCTSVYSVEELDGYTPATPAGLLQIRGQEINPLSEIEIDPVMSGVVCFGERHPVEIIPVQVFKEIRKAFTDCIQAGPLIVIKGRPAVNLEDFDEKYPQLKRYASRPAERSFVLRTGRDETVLGVTERASLIALRAVMLANEKEGGFGAVSAITLTGRSSAGLIIGGGKEPIQRGGTVSFLPNAIVVRE